MKKILSFILASVILMTLLCACDDGAYDIPEDVGTSQKQLVFTSSDIRGGRVSSGDFSDASVIMLNFWDPQSMPSVEEMPVLERLYGELKDSGLVVIGVYSDEARDEDIMNVIEGLGITYPVVFATNDLKDYRTDYYPSTSFFTGKGRPLTEVPYIGYRDYDTWLEIINGFMGE